MRLDSANVPSPRREWVPWAVAAGVVLIAACALAAVLSGKVGARAAPPLPAATATPARDAAPTIGADAGSRVYVSDELSGGAGRAGGRVSAGELGGRVSAGRAGAAERGSAGGRGAAARVSAGGGGAGESSGGNRVASADGAAGEKEASVGRGSGRAGGTEASLGGDIAPDGALATPVGRRWLAGFYPIYEVAEKAFGVNWLLIASIHRQESAFSTAPGTYEGLNFAGCCGGPMQFNVKDGPVSTWDRVAYSYRDGPRPSYYDHRTAAHPSIYDDFDSVMAASHLLSLDGAGYALDDTAWIAAYDYYGHDVDGVRYADEVIARAIGWSQHGFCASCGVQSSLLEAVSAAYGAPVLAVYEAQARQASRRDGGPSGRRSNDHLGRDSVRGGGSAAKQPAR